MVKIKNRKPKIISSEIKTRLPWQGALKLLSHRIFKIRTPRGFGTGFHVGNFGKDNKLCAIATALHVVAEAEDWDEPIKLLHSDSKRVISLKAAKTFRVIFTYPKSDLAIIVFNIPDDFTITNEVLEHLASNNSLYPGVEVGWCGFPGIVREITGGRDDTLCFFHGYISCFINYEEGYLVDGVAINGVSGGPVFFIDNGTNRPKIAGVITAYAPNRTLPGLSMIASVAPYEKTIKFLKNMNEAQKEADKQKQEQKLDGTTPDKSPEVKEIKN